MNNYFNKLEKKFLSKNYTKNDSLKTDYLLINDPKKYFHDSINHFKKDEIRNDILKKEKIKNRCIRKENKKNEFNNIPEIKRNFNQDASLKKVPSSNSHDTNPSNLHTDYLIVV